MNSYDQLRERLPSLYRPEVDDESLINRWLKTCGLTLDGAAMQLQHLLRAHWFDLADKATLDAHYQLDRQHRGLPAVNVRDPKDVSEINRYPYLTDLARLGALFNLPPWREPANEREGVEEYRQRVTDILAAYRLGVTTLPALRRLVEAALPESMGVAADQQRWPFAIEEPVALIRRIEAIVVPSAQEGDLLSPLYYWQIDAAPVAPVLYLQGVTAQGELIAATEQPAIELYTPDQAIVGRALAYQGTLAAGQTLRLMPARHSWLIQAGQLRRSADAIAANRANDAAANGPWQQLSGIPAGQVQALCQAADYSLWLIIEEGGNQTLYRHDGNSFQAINDGAPTAGYRRLHASGRQIYLATDQGLFRCDLFPAEGESYALTAVAAVPEPLHALAALPDGGLACAGSNGLALINIDGSLHSRLLTGTPLQAVHARSDQLYVATDQGLFVQDGGRWFRYDGSGLSEDQPDWMLVEESAIAAGQSPLPAVRSITTTTNGDLWLATTAGFARYRAQQGRTTLLEAYPDLTIAPIHDLCTDERGVLWLAGDDGLFRHDGHYLAHYNNSSNWWLPLGEADRSYPDSVTTSERGHWRYQRSQSQWQRYDATQGRFVDPALPLRTTAQAPITILCFTPSLQAELGQFDGSQFTASADIALDQFKMRIKPNDERIVDGGLPTLPSATVGGYWRYLQQESPALIPPASGRPWWSREGRLFPPPGEPARLPGHFRTPDQPWQADAHFAAALFAYPPSARVWMEYALPPTLGVRIRLFKREAEQTVDPAIIERIWSLLLRARAATVPLQLAVEGAITKDSTVQGESP